MSVSARAAFLILIALCLSCQRPQVDSPPPVSLTLALSPDHVIAATLWPPKSNDNAQNILILTSAEMDARAVARLAQRLSAYDYQVLAVHYPAFRDSTIVVGDALLQQLTIKMPALSAARKDGLLWLGLQQPPCPTVQDTLFRAVLYMTDVEILTHCCRDTTALDSLQTAYGIIIPHAVPLTMTPALLRWLRSPENLIWLATKRSPVEVMVSDMEPIVGRKAQLFFDRYLKGKR